MKGHFSEASWLSTGPELPISSSPLTTISFLTQHLLFGPSVERIHLITDHLRVPPGCGGCTPDALSLADASGVRTGACTCPFIVWDHLRRRTFRFSRSLCFLLHIRKYLLHQGQLQFTFTHLLHIVFDCKTDTSVPGRQYLFHIIPTKGAVILTFTAHP